MFVQVMRCRARPGQERAFIQSVREWRQTHAAGVPGLLVVDFLRAIKDPSDFILIARFQSPEAAMRNALGSRQQTWYHRWVALLEAAPQFTDTEPI